MDENGGPTTPIDIDSSTPCKRKNISIEEYAKRRALNTSSESHPEPSHYGYSGERLSWSEHADLGLEQKIERIVSKQMAEVAKQFEGIKEVLAKIPTTTSEKKPPINESDLRKKKRLDEVWKLLDSFLQMEPENIVDREMIANTMSEVFKKMHEVAVHFSVDFNAKEEKIPAEEAVCGCELCIACANRLKERGISTKCSCGRCMAHQDEVQGISRNPTSSQRGYQQQRRPWRGNNRGNTRGRILPKLVSQQEFGNLLKK